MGPGGSSRWVCLRLLSAGWNKARGSPAGERRSIQTRSLFSSNTALRDGGQDRVLRPDLSSRTAGNRAFRLFATEPQRTQRGTSLSLCSVISVALWQTPARLPKRTATLQQLSLT